MAALKLIKVLQVMGMVAESVLLQYIFLPCIRDLSLSTL